MKFKLLYIFTFLICLTHSLSALDTLKMDSLYQYYEMAPVFNHYIDTENKENINTIIQKTFEKTAIVRPKNITNTYWLSFYLEQDSLQSNYEFSYSFSDSTIFYIPQKNGRYKEVIRGLFTKEEVYAERNSENQKTQLLYISSNDIDFSQPIFIKVRNFTKWGRKAGFSNYYIYKFPKNSQIVYDSDVLMRSILYIGFIAISGFLFLYFLIQAIINKRLSFFLYSLYLVTLFIYFLNRLTEFRFWLAEFSPMFYFYINENMQILSGVFYFLFMIAFLDIKNRYPKLHTIIKLSIWGFIVFMLAYDALFYFNRFNPFHLNMMNYFRSFNLILSLGFIIVIVRNKPRMIEWIVIISGLLLLSAAIIPDLISNSHSAVFFFLAEIFILAIGLAYQVRQSDNERIKTKENLIIQLELNATIQQKMQQKLETEVKLQTEKAIQKTQEAEQAKAEQLKSTFQRELEQIKMKALQAQMNPHFLFNCLNSIRLFYLKNETKKADAYITKFSRLLRLMLNNSRSDLISLQEELDALQLYIEFEQMRFKDKFDFELSIDNQVNTNDFRIQPLTIQPFVENAIWHGLMQNEQAGKLKIDIQQIAQKTLISIEDNGIGRAKARQLKAGQNQIHKSHGLTITKERMDLMKKSLNREANFQIIDLKNDNAEAIGTRVEIVYR